MSGGRGSRSVGLRRSFSAVERAPAGDNKSKTDDPACRAKCLTRERFSKSVCRFVWSSGARCAPRLNASARRDHHATVRRNAATAEWRTRRGDRYFSMVLLYSCLPTVIPRCPPRYLVERHKTRSLKAEARIGTHASPKNLCARLGRRTRSAHRHGAAAADPRTPSLLNRPK